MKVIVLSCNTGEGHNTAGKAIYSKFLQLGVECDFKDTLSIAGMNVSRAVNNSYVGITTSVPSAFGMIYSIGRTVSDLNTRHLISRGMPHLPAHARASGYSVYLCSHGLRLYSFLGGNKARLFCYSSSRSRRGFLFQKYTKGNTAAVRHTGQRQVQKQNRPLTSP